MTTILREVLLKIANMIASKWDKNIPMTTIVRQSTREIYGDICIPGGVVKMHFPTEKHVEEVVKTVMLASETLDFPVLSCSPADKDFIAIRLQRAPVFSHVIRHVMKEGNDYGHLSASRDKAVLVNVPGTLKRTDSVKLSALRQHLLAQHICALLEAVGYHVHHTHDSSPWPSSTAIDKILGGIPSGEAPITESGEIPVAISSSVDKLLPPHLLEEFSNSKFVASVACQTDEDMNHHRADDNRSPDVHHSPVSYDQFPKRCCLDLRAVIEDQTLKSGKGGYSKNMAEVQLTDEYGKPSSVLMQCVNMMNRGENLKPSTGVSILHVIPTSQEFQQQQVDLTLRALFKDGRFSDQSHLCCAPVHLSGAALSAGGRSHGMGVEEFYGIRHSQMKEASVMKYGDQVKGGSWEEMIQSLTVAGIKFDILGTHHRHPVKLDVGERNESSPWRDNRNGVFVIYNYARLSTLFTRFEEEVQKGTYPSLPPVEDIDFSMLREESEWKLLFSHVLTLPDVVLESIGEGITTPWELACKFETHKICRYLISLSQDLSMYYSRFRILVEPRPHLLPTMYARIYLLKAVHQVLRNGLCLLRIKPLNQM